MDKAFEMIGKGLPEFDGGNVPIAVAAKVMHKDKVFIREGLKQGILNFGYAFKKDGKSTYDYYISPLKFYLETGYVYRNDSCR